MMSTAHHRITVGTLLLMVTLASNPSGVSYASLAGAGRSFLVKTVDTGDMQEFTGQIDWEEQSKLELANLNKETATRAGAFELCEKYLDLLQKQEITLTEYHSIIERIYQAYSAYGVSVDRATFNHKGQYRQYIDELKSGKYDYLVQTLKYDEDISFPEGEDLTSSQKLVLEMAKHVGVRWANGEGISGGRNLRYDQGVYATYTSDITGDAYRIRTDCSGFVYSLLRELGSTEFQNYPQGSVPNTQTLTGLCATTFSLDPRITILPFDVDSLQPGDIMVASKDERLTRWGTNIPYVSAGGVPIRKGHTEVFVRWADESTQQSVMNYIERSQENTEVSNDANYYLADDDLVDDDSLTSAEIDFNSATQEQESTTGVIESGSVKQKQQEAENYGPGFVGPTGVAEAVDGIEAETETEVDTNSVEADENGETLAKAETDGTFRVTSASLPNIFNKPATIEAKKTTLLTSSQQQTKRVMEVYSWGSSTQVTNSFVGLSTARYNPLTSTKDYNYSYIIRFVGGYDLWQSED